MTLREVIDSVDDDALLKIGATESSGFFFCGTKAQFEEGYKEFESKHHLMKASLLDYPVLDQFEASPVIEPTPTTVIMIAGVLIGCFWTTSEVTDSPFASKSRSGRPTTPDKNKTSVGTRKKCLNCAHWDEISRGTCIYSGKKVVTGRATRCRSWTERTW